MSPNQWSEIDETHNETDAHGGTTGGRSRHPQSTRGKPDPRTANSRDQWAEFRRDIEFGRAIQISPRKPGADARRCGGTDGHRRAGALSIGNGQDAEPNGCDAV